MFQTHRFAVGLSALVIAVCAMSGCQFEPEKTAPATAPPPTFTGPPFLRNTVGSMAYLENYRSLLVGGYGIVVLKEPTGSSEVPPFLRQNLINEMLKQGVGSASQGWKGWTPQRMLADPRTAIVEVYGFIPAGAVPGTRFDLWLKALDGTQTTSLTGGTLWTLTLSVDGTDPRMMFRKRAAEGRGPIYMNPFDGMMEDKAKRQQLREAVVVAGGRAVRPQQIQLILNQPSFRRARVVSDRINERFSRTTDQVLIARPQDERTIVLWIPPRWQGRTAELLELISCLYIQSGQGYEKRQARELTQVLVERPQYTRDIVNAWRALGKMAIPVLQDFYDAADLNLQMSALEAGAWLGDARAGRFLYELSLHPDPAIRRRVAEVLVYLPGSLDASRTLKALLDDEDVPVRIAAYESLAQNSDQMVDRFPVFDELNDIKFVIDRVPVSRSLIYITQSSGVPRLVLFNGQLGFQPSMIAKLWDRHLMLKRHGDNSWMTMFYQAPGEVEGITYQLNATVATLAYMMAHRPTMERPQDGLDLTYSQVVDAIHRLTADGHIDAPIELDISPLARRIAEYEASPEHTGEGRPEFGPEPPPSQTEPDAPTPPVASRPEF